MALGKREEFVAQFMAEASLADHILAETPGLQRMGAISWLKNSTGQNECQHVN
jgi:hypothetical protein